jgi:hypothetical protein
MVRSRKRDDVLPGIRAALVLAQVVALHARGQRTKEALISSVVRATIILKTTVRERY